MRLLYFSDSIIPSRSANSVHVMKMCASFSKKIDTTLFCLINGATKTLFDKYSVKKSFTVKGAVFVKGKISLLIYTIRCTAFLIFSSRQNLVYGRFAPAILIASWLGYSRVGLEVHQPATSKLRHWVYKKLFSSKHFSFLIVINEKLRKHYIQQYNLNSSQIIVLHDGADEFKCTSEGNPFVDSKKLQVTYIGQLYKGKAMEIIIPLAKSLPDVSFNIIGGNEEDITHWKQQTHSNNVIFYGYANQNELAAYKMFSDVFVAPYSRVVNPSGGNSNIAKWMSPLKIFEYMAAKKPIIASDLPSIQEVLLHKETALLCSPDMIEEWVAAITILYNKKERERLSENAFLEFNKKYTWDIRSEKIISLFKKSI